MSDYIEQNCTFEHGGVKWEYGGAVVTDDYVVGYIEDDTVSGKLLDWHGGIIGFYQRTARWATPRSYFSSHMSQYRITIPAINNGSFDTSIPARHYTGRGAGKGMIVKAKRVASER